MGADRDHASLSALGRAQKGFIIKESLKKQRWGDEWAHTVVCKRSSVAPERLRSDARFALGMTLALMADTAVRMVGLLLHIHS